MVIMDHYSADNGSGTTTDVDELLRRIGQLRQILGVQQAAVAANNPQRFKNSGQHNVINGQTSKPSKRPSTSKPHYPSVQNSFENRHRNELSLDLDNEDEDDRRSNVAIPIDADKDNRPDENGRHRDGDDRETCCQSARSACTESDDATVALLNDVTFVRVVVESAEFDRPIENLKQARHQTVSRRVFLDYQFPATDEDYETLRKHIHVPAKTVLPTVINFNHRRVALMKVTPDLLESWSKATLWFRLLLESGNPKAPSVTQIGRSCVRLDQLLTPPFAVEDHLPIEQLPHQQMGAAVGRLKVLVQLGSRQPNFNQRVAAYVSQFGVTKKKNKSSQSTTGKTSLKTHIVGESGGQHPCKHDSSTGVSPNIPDSVQHLSNGRYRIDDPDVLLPRVAWPNDRSSHGVVLSSSPPISDRVRPRVPISTHDRAAQSREWQSAAVQTDNVGGSDDGIQHAHSGTRARTDSGPLAHSTLDDTSLKTVAATKHNRDTQQQQHNIRSTVVADRFRASLSPRRLRLTVHAAYDLPLVKGEHSQQAVLPCAFVTYRAGDQLATSSVVHNSTQPQWNWSTTLNVPDDRKNLVLKVWHQTGVSGRDRVLGFVSLDLNGLSRLPSSGFYDLVDLSQSSTGRLQVTLERVSASTTGCSELPKTTATKTHSDKGMNTSFVPDAPQQRTPSPLYEQYLQTISREFLEDKLRSNMSELDMLLARLQSETEGQ